MKSLFLLFLFFSPALFAGNALVVTEFMKPLKEDSIKTDDCLGLGEAEKILGQPSKLTESSSEIKNGVKKIRCIYSAIEADLKTNKNGNLYYTFEEYPDVLSAQKAYADIVFQNKSMPGQEKMNDLGDEAFRHTDKENFLLIISRKENRIIRMKVNKLTSYTAPDQLQLILKKRIAP